MKKETKDEKIYSLQVELKGVAYAGITMLILAAIYYIYEIFTGKGSNPALYSIITIYNAILFGYKAFKIENKRKINIINSIVWGLLTVTLILFYFKII